MPRSPHPNRRYTEEDDAAINALRIAGVSWLRIAAEHFKRKMSANAVRSHAVKCNLACMAPAALEAIAEMRQPPMLSERELEGYMPLPPFHPIANRELARGAVLERRMLEAADV